MGGKKHSNLLAVTFSFNNSGETYSAVPTNELGRPFKKKE